MPSNFLTMPPLASPNDVMDHNEHCNLVKAVEKPTLIDVVNGRGQGVHKHPGNEKYRKLVASNKVRNIHGYVVGAISWFVELTTTTYLLSYLTRWCAGNLCTMPKARQGKGV
jgi:hypothetical protein